MDQNECAELLEEVNASPTMARIADLAAKARQFFDMCEPEQLKFITAINAIEVVRGIDTGLIKLEDPTCRAAVLRLLWAAMELIHGGRFGSDAMLTEQVR